MHGFEGRYYRERKTARRLMYPEMLDTWRGDSPGDPNYEVVENQLTNSIIYIYILLVL